MHIALRVLLQALTSNYVVPRAYHCVNNYTYMPSLLYWARVVVVMDRRTCVYSMNDLGLLQTIDADNPQVRFRPELG